MNTTYLPSTKTTAATARPSHWLTKDQLLDYVISDMARLDELDPAAAEAIASKRDVFFNADSIVVGGRWALRSDLEKLDRDIQRALKAAQPVAVPVKPLAEFVAAFVALLTDADVRYAGAVERGGFRGYAALDDLHDAGQLALDAGLPEPDGTMERLTLIDSYLSAATEGIRERWKALLDAERAEAFAG